MEFYNIYRPHDPHIMIGELADAVIGVEGPGDAELADFTGVIFPVRPVDFGNVSFRVCGDDRFMVDIKIHAADINRIADGGICFHGGNGIERLGVGADAAVIGAGIKIKRGGAERE